MKKLFTLSTLLFAAACGDDNTAAPDAGITPDTQTVDAAVDAAPVWTAPTPFEIDISAAGPDQVMTAAPGPAGTFYIAGYTAANATTGTDKLIFVAKLTATGTLDAGFGTGGIYTSDVVFKGGSDEIDMVVQSSGKIVVATTVANNTNAADKDVGLFRVNADGTRDTAFAGTGFSRQNLSDAYNDNGTLKALDASRGLALGPNDTLFIHAASRDIVADAGASIDTDYTVAKLSAEGVLDTAYGTLGKTLVDIQNKDATVRGIHAFADGSVLAGGYARTVVSNDTPQPVLYRLDSSGDLDVNFGGGSGIYHEQVLTAQTEIYGFAIHTNDVTTAGYGREAAAGMNVYTPMRFNATTGARLTTFGGATAGVPTFDPSGGTTGNNNRGAIALPGGKTALIGSTGDSGGRKAALVVITQNGQADTAYGTGLVSWSLGGTEDQWWGGAVNNGKLLLVGWKGFGATQSDAANDDAFGVLIPIE